MNFDVELDSEMSVCQYVFPQSKKWKQVRHPIGVHRITFSTLAKIEVWASLDRFPNWLDKGVQLTPREVHEVKCDPTKLYWLAYRGEYNQAMPLCVCSYTRKQ
jgi:hypothetical protein